MLLPLKIGFLGAGRMSQALVRGLIEGKVVSSRDQIIASDVDENQRKLVTVSELIHIEHVSRLDCPVSSPSLNWVLQPLRTMNTWSTEVIFSYWL